MTAWRVARSLDVLLEQFNHRYPNRSKASDGSIGDAAHASRESDHNPWYGPGIVTARDFTHDPAVGMDIDRLTGELRDTRDPRIKYVIANRQIMSGAGGPSPWVWKPYSGPNPHTKHFHLSVVASPLCDDTRPWDLPSFRTQEDDDMAPILDQIRTAVADELAIHAARKDELAPARRVDVGYARDQLRGDAAAIRTVVVATLNAVANDVEVDVDALVERIDTNVRAALAETHPAGTEIPTQEVTAP